MSRAQLIDAILVEIERVWPGYHLAGTAEQYEWLRAYYRITAVEDIRWQLILEHSEHEMRDDDRADGELMAFLDNDAAVTAFLQVLLDKYRSNSVVHEHRVKPRDS
jgi:hypothetical protein